GVCRTGGCPCVLGAANPAPAGASPPAPGRPAPPPPADTPLAAYVSEADGPAEGGEDIAVAIQGAEEAGLEPYLGAPVADVLAACAASGGAGDVAATVVRVGEVAGRLLFLGLGDGSEADLRTAGGALGRRVTPGHRMLVSAVRGQPAEAVRAFAEGLLLGSYRFSLASGREAGGEPGARPGGPPGEVRLLVAAEGTGLAAVDEARIVAEAVALAPRPAKTPSLAQTPAPPAGQPAP